MGSPTQMNSEDKEVENDEPNNTQSEEFNSSQIEVSANSLPYKISGRENGDIKSAPRHNKQLSDSNIIWVFIPQTIVISSEMFAIFEDCINSQGFEVIERQPLEAIAVKTVKKGVVDYVKLCVPCLSQKTKFISFKFCIVESKGSRVERVEFRGLTGDSKTLDELFEYFKKVIEKKEGIYGKSDCIRNSKRIESFSGSSTKYTVLSDKTYHEDQSGIEIESNRIVYINKQLASKNYGVGKTVATFVDNFKAKLKEADCNVKNMMAELISFVHEIQVTLAMEGNLGSEAMRKFLPLGKFISEKYIQDQVYDDFFAFYKRQYQDRDLLFKAKTDILRVKRPLNVMSNQDVKDKFTQVEPGATVEDLKTYQPYSSAVFEQNKLSHCKSPREKLDCITMMNSQMRSSILRYHNMNLELESMDDELPITIYILGFTEIADMISNLHYIKNYVELHQQMDSEEKMITHIIASTDYIVKNWDLDEIIDQ